MQPPGEQSILFDGDVPMSPKGDRITGTRVHWSVTPTPTGRPGAGTRGVQQWGRGSGSSTVILSSGSPPKDKGHGFFKPHQTTGCLNPSPGLIPSSSGSEQAHGVNENATCGMVLSPSDWSRWSPGSCLVSPMRPIGLSAGTQEPQESLEQLYSRS